ncbi:hypothetical protein ACFFHJ_35010 [Planotetraspora thailandica]|uniref:hypothetical protein n=1 Tax=Planotetraspora thailandica TaxID=487172 RepID=UPI00194F67A5|nr:hypothetical protein [Planotetraspora thailandica]
MLRQRMQQAQPATTQADAPPGYGVTPDVIEARLRAADAEWFFAARVMQLGQPQA